MKTLLPDLFTILAPVLFISLLSPLTSPSPLSYLPRGSSLPVEDGSVLVSPDNSFSCGFYNVGPNAYTFSVWFSNSANKTTAWTANRDSPVNGKGSRIAFQNNGLVVLTDVDGTIVWSTNTTGTNADRVQLLNTGNLVVQNSKGNILWQSFDSPADTLLPTQPITKNIKLVSERFKGSISSGYFSFFFDNDNVLRMIYDGPEISSIYWPNPDYQVFQNGRTTYNSSRYGVLDEMGQFLASDRLAFNASDAGLGIKRRLTMDYDGNLRLYSLNHSNGMWSVSWQALPQLCNVHGLCGRNGICVYRPKKTECSCPPGYEMRNTSDWSEGCKPKFEIVCNSSQKFRFVELPNTDFWGYDVNYTPNISLKECRDQCKRDCTCEAFGYRMGAGTCYTKSALFNGKSSPETNNNIFVKLPRGINISKLSSTLGYQLICNAMEVSIHSSDIYVKSSTETKWDYFYWFIAAIFGIEIFFMASGWWFIYRKEKPKQADEGYKIISNQFRNFTYRELEKATAKFKNELGKGGSGAVYKGVLDDERVVAVKKLKDAIQGQEEFWAEVSVIGRIYHMNLVRMWGFCSERAHRLLVSEYVENGSLDKTLFDHHSGGTLLEWSKRFKIAVGVAKGLAYLHHECLEWVIHCDVKPENVLLDKDFEPKIADFGLAKLLIRGGTGSNVSTIRGTRGYIAPEWASSLPITGKVDVYSYGVVLLELMKGSRVSDWVMDGEREVELVLRKFCVMLKGKLASRDESWVGNLVDSRLNGEFNCKQATLMVELAISCLEEERSKRPTMDSVVQILLSCDEPPNYHDANLL